MLEQVTRELTIEALPTDIPDSIQHDVSELVIGDTVTLEAVTPPAGVTLLDDPETVIATLSPPRLQLEEEPEIEEETELVAEGETGDGGRGGGRRRGRPAARAGTRRRVAPSPMPQLPGEAPVDWLIVGLGNPGRRVRRARATTSASRSRTCWRDRWALPKAKSKYRGLLTDGPDRPRRPAGGDPSPDRRT